MNSTPALGSALKPRPVPEDQVLSGADQNRMRHAYQIIADMISSSRSDEKKSLIVWETTRFVVNIAEYLGLPLPIAETVSPTTRTTPAPRSATTRTANADPVTPESAARTNRFVESDNGTDEETIQSLRDLGIRQSDGVELALGQALAARKITVLTPITFGPHLNTSIDTLVSQRNDFIEDLLGAEVPVMKNLTQEIHTFTRDEAHRIANQIFNDLVGISAVKHVEALLTEYNAVNAAGLNSAVGAKAQRLSNDPEIPKPLRDFLSAFAAHQRIQSKTAKPKLTALHETATELTLHRRINKLMNPPTSRERRLLLAFFQDNGYLESGRGQRLKTRVKKFFLEELGLTENSLTWITDSLLPVSHMANLFGNGILIFLNREHIRQIRVFGIAKIAFAFALVDRHCPWVADLADMADQHMLSPILAGESLANLRFKTNPTIPWASRFQQIGDGGDVEMEG